MSSTSTASKKSTEIYRYDPETYGVPKATPRSLEEARALLEDTVGPDIAQIIRDFNVRTIDDSHVDVFLFGKPHQIATISSIILEVVDGDPRVYNAILQRCSAARFSGSTTSEVSIYMPGNIQLHLWLKPARVHPTVSYSSAGFSMPPEIESAMASGVIRVVEYNEFDVRRYLSYGLVVETFKAHTGNHIRTWIPDSPWNTFGSKMPNLEGSPYHYSKEAARCMYMEMLDDHKSIIDGDDDWQDYLAPVHD